MMEKIRHAIGNQILPLKCSLGIGYGIGRKYLPIWVLVSVLDLNQNSVFGRTLGKSKFGYLSFSFEMSVVLLRAYSYILMSPVGWPGLPIAAPLVHYSQHADNHDHRGIVMPTARII